MRWLNGSGPALNVITRGAESTLVATQSETHDVPALPVEVVFDVGAGDTYHAGFLARYSEGADVIDCVRFATHAAALKIQRPPLIDQLPTREEVERALATG
jgi:sugar/nucleoside kinase (ribokinase family)